MTSAPLEPAAGPPRRTVIAAAGAAGAAAVLTACGSGGPAGGSPDSGGSAASGTALGRTTDIPEGGGTVFADEGVVVTQPAAGSFKAFSTVCTHRQCAVTSVSNGEIVCPCHGSRFSVADGSVKKGPALQPLPAKKITVVDGEIKLA